MPRNAATEPAKPGEDDHAAPPLASRFRLVHDRRGPRLAIVLGNEAPGGRCPWAEAGRCHHCDIGLGEGRSFDAASNHARLGWLEAAYQAAWPTLRHLVLYNSGSTLNPRELSPAVLHAALRFAGGLPAIRLVSLDSREAFVSEGRVLEAARALGPGRELRVILGIESADERVRERHLEKRMPRHAIERAAGALGHARQAALEAPNTLALPGLSVNVVIGAPGTSERSAVADARATCEYALHLASEHRLDLDINLHPYYPSQRALRRFPDHPRASRETILASICAARAVAGDRATLFLGWQDEGHDQEPTERTDDLRRHREIFDRFNRTGRLGGPE